MNIVYASWYNGRVTKLIRVTSRPLTAKQRAYVKFCGEGYLRTKAARLAGYSDPSHAQAELMQNPRVLRELAAGGHQRCVAWRHLMEASKLALLYALTPEHYMPRDGREPLVKVAECLAACRIVLDTLLRLDKGSLLDRADNEDNARSPEEAARRILGPAA